MTPTILETVLFIPWLAMAIIALGFTSYAAASKGAWLPAVIFGLCALAGFVWIGRVVR